MDEPIYTAADRHRYRPTPCPECGSRRELGWVDVSNSVNTDQWRPNEKCRNRQCSEFRDPNSLAGG
ncbi:hypothetical protein [Dactylosporangium sp. CA-139066]|uniref:hypothetical protein n=1 Tax=Dactylosporangium sp. CA-139066 TaxID=3239930 RepID=UPI003D90E710